MSYIAITTHGLKVQYYCEDCYDQYEEDAPTTDITFREAINGPAPICPECDMDMMWDYVLIPPAAIHSVREDNI
jgi:NAD-dependent SIR2 family protein deacetylase